MALKIKYYANFKQDRKNMNISELFQKKQVKRY